MNKFRFISLLSAAVISMAAFTSCGDKTKVSTPDKDKLPSRIENYAEDPEIAKTKSESKLGNPITINDTEYTLNAVIDAGIVLDNLRYYYLDINVKNTSDKDYSINALNNFYLILPDKSEVLSNVRADLYAKQSFSEYEQFINLDAGAEYDGYVGFCVEPDVDEFTVCFFPTGDSNDKSNVVFTEITPDMIIAPPDGLIVK